jgi:uncharacterized protein YndB with AHSA1/START domain
MSGAERATVTVSLEIAASPDRVFDEWLNPDRAKRWLFSTPTGEMIRAELDPRVGGKFVYTDRRDGVDIDHMGEFLEIDRPHRLTFTFSVPHYSSESTTVRLWFEPTPVGCEVALHHEGILPEWAEPSRQGWTEILAKLAAAVEGK